jgi:predicted TIM-barrel fold metal-dependent hydrolase
MSEMFKLFSVDDHIVEPADVWSSRVPAKFRDVAPHVIEEDGREYWVYEDQRGLTMGLNAVAGLPREQWNSEPARFTDMIPGCYDPKARAHDLLSQGVLASVNFPTLPRFGGALFATFQDKDLASVCVRAWNDFILDEWCPGGPPGMFVPMIICQMWDPPAAAKEIERCVAKGAKALCFVENAVPLGLPSFHQAGHWDPIWQVAQDADIPVCMHIGSSGVVPVSDPEAGLALLISLGSVAGMLSMANLLLSPVCANFPRLKVVWSEAGIGWIPALLERCDRQLERHHFHTGRHSDASPTEIFQRQMYACMVEEPIGLQLWEMIGADNILAETDYPHADTPYPATQDAYREVFEGIPDDVIAKVSHQNAERVFNWQMADEALLLSPDVSSWRATLDEDPYAAMKLRHDVTGIDHLTSHHDEGSTCTTMVLKGAMYEPCGLPRGPNGHCPEGH